MRGPEFVVAVKFRLGLNIYDKAGKCPSCGKESDELGDHGMMCATLCGTGGESISRVVVVITFSKADAERLRLIKRELRLTSDYYKSD